MVQGFLSKQGKGEMKYEQGSVDFQRQTEQKGTKAPERPEKGNVGFQPRIPGDSQQEKTGTSKEAPSGKRRFRMGHFLYTVRFLLT